MFNKISFVTTLLSMFLTCPYQVSAQAHGPGGTGGGSGVICTAHGSAFPTHGLYAYDYAIQSNGNWVVTSGNAFTHLQTVANLFQTKLQGVFPGSGSELKRFADEVSENRGNWRTFNYVMRPTFDAARGNLPQNCEGTLHQITTRTGSVFLTSPQLLAQLQQTSELQVSVHLVHEMLRIVFNDSNKIARMTRALHDPELLNMSIQDWQDYVLHEGLAPRLQSPVLQASARAATQNRSRGTIQSQFHAMNERVRRLQTSSQSLSNEIRAIDPLVAGQDCRWFQQNKDILHAIVVDFLTIRNDIGILQVRVFDRMSELSFNSRERMSLLSIQEELGNLFRSIGDFNSFTSERNLGWAITYEQYYKRLAENCR